MGDAAPLYPEELRLWLHGYWAARAQAGLDDATQDELTAALVGTFPGRRLAVRPGANMQATPGATT